MQPQTADRAAINAAIPIDTCSDEVYGTKILQNTVDEIMQNAHESVRKMRTPDAHRLAARVAGIVTLLHRGGILSRPMLWTEGDTIDADLFTDGAPEEAIRALLMGGGFRLVARSVFGAGENATLRFEAPDDGGRFDVTCRAMATTAAGLNADDAQLAQAFHELNRKAAESGFPSPLIGMTLEAALADPFTRDCLRARVQAQIAVPPRANG